MGELFFFRIGEFLKNFRTETFFETGTGYGFGVQYARMYRFKKIYSVDIVASEIERLTPAFGSDPRVELFAGLSVEAMRQILPKVPGNMLFWLDAHFPGAHHALQAYDGEADLDTRLPLEQELALIKQLRAGKRDIILIDDLRIYETDEFQWGNLSDAGLAGAGKAGSEFMYTTFQETHDAHRFLNHSGYLALIPKTATPFEIVPNITS